MIQLLLEIAISPKVALCVEAGFCQIQSQLMHLLLCYWCPQVMVHTEFSEDLDQFPYNVDDDADINDVLVVSKQAVICVLLEFTLYSLFRDFLHSH